MWQPALAQIAKFLVAGMKRLHTLGPHAEHVIQPHWLEQHNLTVLVSCLSAREVGAECCVAQSLNASPIQYKAAQQTTQSSTIKLQEPRPGSQSVMQAHNSQQAQGEGINHLHPEKDWSTP